MVSDKLYSKLYILEKTKTSSRIISLCLIYILMLISPASMAKTIIACVGNSITERGGEEGYVNLIAIKLGDEYDVRNFGLGGRTMLKNGKMPYWKEEKFKELFKLKPDIITLMLGTNDSKTSNWSKHGHEFKADAQAMVDTLLFISSRPELFLVLPPHAFENKNDVNDSIISNLQVPILRSIAEQKEISVIDAHTPTDSCKYFRDGIHPNAEGHQVIADAFYESLSNNSIEFVHRPHGSKRNQKFYQNTNTGVLVLSILPGKALSYTVNSSKQMEFGIYKERIFLLNGKLIAITH